MRSRLDLERGRHRFKAPLELRFCPVQVRSIRKVLAVEIESLAKPHEHAELLDERLAAKPGLARLFKRVGELGDRKEVRVERFFEYGKRSGARERLGVGVPREEGRHVERGIRWFKRSGVGGILERGDASEDDQVALYARFPGEGGQ